MYVKLNLFFVYNHVMLTVVIGVIGHFCPSRCYRLNLFLRCNTRIQRDRQGVDDKRRRVGAPLERERAIETVLSRVRDIQHFLDA